MTEVELPDGTIVEFPEGTSREEMRAALARKFGGATPEANNGGRAIATVRDGTVFEMPDGSKAFKSPGYATTDPEAIARLMDGDGVKMVLQSGVDRQTIDQHPIAARGIKALEGVPFVGSYVDEAAGAMFGDKAGNAVRASSEAMAREKPGQSMALQVGGGIASAAPLIAAAAPSVANSAIMPAARWGKAGVTGLLGGAGGAIEGGIYGAGRGETATERKSNAANDAMFGGLLGGVLGAGAPLLADGAKAIFQKIKGDSAEAIAKRFGVSKKAAGVIKSHIDVDDLDGALRALDEGGGSAMLGEASKGAASLLDATAAMGGRAGNVVNDAIEGRVSQANKQFTGAADGILGPAPQGKLTALDAVAERSADARKAAYGEAYQTPINYASPEGAEILDLLGRVDQKELAAAVEDVNKRLRFKPDGTEHIMASIGDDGIVSFKQLPNVQQLDKLKQALQRSAQAYVDPLTQRMGEPGQFLSDQARAVRDATKDAVPAYGRAVQIGGDKIAEQQALDMGSNMLKPSVTRDDVIRQMSGASENERAAAALGFRNAIDETMARVKSVASDQNLDAREVGQIIENLSSRSTRKKARALLGDKAAGALFETVDELSRGFQLRAAVAENSKTARRGIIHGDIADAAAPNALQRLAGGEPVASVKETVRLLTGEGADAQAFRASGIAEEIAGFLTSQKGETAKAALIYINKALEGQRITEAQASLVANYLAASGFSGGLRLGQQSLQ